MKLRKGFLAILALFIVASGPLAKPCQADTLIGFTDINSTDDVSFRYPLSDTIILYGSWTQTVPSANTTIGAIITKAFSDLQGTGHAWLMNRVGPGAIIANQIAATEFTAPFILYWGELNTAPYTTLFTGLSLSPGTYYLVLQGPAIDVLDNNPYNWLGMLGYGAYGVEINTAAGFTVGTYGYTATPASYIPASDFNLAEGYLFYRVEGSVVPAPATLLLLGSGLAAMFCWRRKAQK